MNVSSFNTQFFKNLSPLNQSYVNFLAWNSVTKEIEYHHNQQHGNSSNYRNASLVTYYQENEPNPLLKGGIKCQ